MSISFKNILIPVDLSINTEVAVKKGLDLAESGSTIHLLHVQSYALPGLLEKRRKYLDEVYESEEINEQKIKQWKWTIEDSVNDITVCVWIMPGNSVQDAIEQKAKQLAVDLIIIGKNSEHSWFPFLNTVVPSRIVKKTGIAVLTAKPGSLHNKVRTVIVPIASQASEHKLEIISAICRKFRLKVHLVTFMNDRNQLSDFYASSLLKVYQRLETSSHCQVEYALLHGNNKAKAVLNYAKKINADILLLHPETETKIGWLNRHISDMVPPASKLQVLTVQPVIS